MRIVIPKGAWHLDHIHEPSEALFFTRGKGTEHKPLAKGDRNP